MKIIHTADLHLGQIIYQNYERRDEHQFVMNQIEDYVAAEKPDALIVAGDIFDVQQPSAAVWRDFTETFARLRRRCQSTHLVIVAGNHDSASRIQAQSAVWGLASTCLTGMAPPPNFIEGKGLEENFIVRLPAGYIISLPFMGGDRTSAIQHLLDYVAAENTEGKPVVMTGHAAVCGGDFSGHDIEHGRVSVQPLGDFGTGYDYLALGHIHKPQTIGHEEDCYSLSASYHGPVARYSGSPIHVSADENYPHSLSLVEIEGRGGHISIRLLPVKQLRHFITLPSGQNEAFVDVAEALDAVKDFVSSGKEGYIRLAFDYKTVVPADFNQRVYDLIEPSGGTVRYNPTILWLNRPEETIDQATQKPTFRIHELQEMESPLAFIEKTIDKYPELDLSEIRECFKEIEEELRITEDGERLKSRKRTGTLPEQSTPEN